MKKALQPQIQNPKFRIPITILSFFIPFIVYLKTLSPTLTFGDAGDHVACGYILGLAHPSGYCLYTIITKLASYIPISNIAMRMGFITIVISSCAIFVLFLSLEHILKHPVPSGHPSKRGEDQYIAFSSSLIFAFSSTFWKIASYIKIYSLFVLFVSLCFYIIFIWHRQKKKKYLYLLAFIYGLAVSNHNLSATIFPSLFYLVFVTDKRAFKPKILFNLFLLFLLGFSIYLYLPIRALAKPEIDWGFPITFKAFVDYVTIAMAREKMFSSFFFKNLSEHIGVVIKQFSFLLVFVVPGFIRLFKERRLFFFILLTIIVNSYFSLSVYAKIEELVDMESYNLPTFLCTSILIGFGMKYIIEYFKKIPQFVFVLLFIISLSFNYHKSDFSRYYFAYDFGRNLLKPLPNNAILFDRIDLEVFPLWYFQCVEEVRRDVSIIPIHFLQRPWFMEKIIELHPWISSPKTMDILKTQDKIWAESREIMGMYEKTMSAIIQSNEDNLPIYYTFFRKDERIDTPYIDRIEKDGLIYRLKLGISNTVLPKNEYTFSYRGVFDKTNKDVWAREIIYSYSYYHADLGQYYLNMGKADSAIKELEMAIKFDPNNSSYMGTLGAAYGVVGRFKDACSILEKALEKEPNNEVFKEYLEMARRRL
ncbi:MAG: DUF2723 domain-containing protein [bacterium]